MKTTSLTKSYKFFVAPKAVEYIFAITAIAWGLGNLLSALGGRRILQTPLDSLPRSFYWIDEQNLIFVTLIPLVLGLWAFVAAGMNHWRSRCWCALLLSTWWLTLTVYYVKDPLVVGGVVSYAIDALVELWIWGRIMLRSDEV